jgi:hypothetical protein
MRRAKIVKSLENSYLLCKYNLVRQSLQGNIQIILFKDIYSQFYKLFYLYFGERMQGRTPNVFI